jgi:hypothetical protein
MGSSWRREMQDTFECQLAAGNGMLFSGGVHWEYNRQLLGSCGLTSIHKKRRRFLGNAAISASMIGNSMVFGKPDC